MKTKVNYISPKIEILNLEVEGIIATSLEVDKTGYTGTANSRERGGSLWDME